MTDETSTRTMADALPPDPEPSPPPAITVAAPSLSRLPTIIGGQVLDIPAFFQYLIHRFLESSTWRSLVVGLTAFGMYIKPEQQDFIVTGGVALFTAIGILFPDKIGLK